MSKTRIITRQKKLFIRLGRDIQNDSKGIISETLFRSYCGNEERREVHASATYNTKKD